MQSDLRGRGRLPGHRPRGAAPPAGLRVGSETCCRAQDPVAAAAAAADEAAGERLFRLAAQYIALAAALQPGKDVYRRSLGVVRELLPRPALRAGALLAADPAAAGTCHERRAPAFALLCRLCACLLPSPKRKRQEVCRSPTPPRCPAPPARSAAPRRARAGPQVGALLGRGRPGRPALRGRARRRARRCPRRAAAAQVRARPAGRSPPRAAAARARHRARGPQGAPWRRGGGQGVPRPQPAERPRVLGGAAQPARRRVLCGRCAPPRACQELHDGVASAC